RDVNEHIRPAAVLHDKAEAPLGVEKLNGTCGHGGLLWKTRNRVMPHTNHSHGPHIRIWRGLGESPLAGETARQAKSERPVYRERKAALQSRLAPRAVNASLISSRRKCGGGRAIGR